MEVNIQNCTLNNVQTGNGNTMIIEDDTLQNHWSDLEKLINAHLEENKLQNEQCALMRQALVYIEKQDESGFIGFLKKNKDSFLINVLSELASSGLMSALKIL